MFELGVLYEKGLFVYVYAFVVVLMATEFMVRKKMNLGTISHTPAHTVGWAVMMVRSAVLLLVLLMAHPMIYFVVFLTLATYIPQLMTWMFVSKWVLFVLWIFFILLKAFFERKYLNPKSASVTLAFGIPCIALLYSIFTSFF